MRSSEQTNNNNMSDACIVFEEESTSNNESDACVYLVNDNNKSDTNL